MRKVKDAVNLTTNEKIYFKGHAKATYMSDGRTVEDAIIGVSSLVFKAVYGTTTYEEIVAAYKAGKWVVCAYGNRNYHLSSIDSYSAFFATAEANANHRLWVNTNNKWYNSTYVMITIGDKVTTINESSVDTKVPSAKAVYDFVQSTLGTIINGDY